MQTNRKVTLPLILLNALLATPAAHAMPASWYGLPEDGAAVTEAQPKEVDALAGSLDEMAQTTADALDEASPINGGIPKGDVRWHPEYFLTDLSVSVGGLLGLTMKGTPAVTLIWRKQYPKPAPVPAPNGPGPIAKEDAPADLVLDDQTAPDDMIAQLEPAIQAALASGRVKDEGALRRNLLAQAKDFQELALGLAAAPHGEWWVSRFRLDLMVEGSGKVTPVITAGGDLRFRFEWHRMMTQAPHVKRDRELSPRARKLGALVGALAEDLTEAAKDLTPPEGFKGYGFRVGVGATASGNIGIVKGTASFLGQVYFSRDVPKPVVNPKPKDWSALPSLTVIESAPTDQHLAYAAAHGIAYEKGGGEAAFQVDRAQIRKGLARSMKMASFFARHAARAKHGHWKVHELRTAFDLSITGTVGVVGVGGLATTEINFYNESF